METSLIDTAADSNRASSAPTPDASTQTGSLAAMAGSAKAGRNRAVDAYRAVAMLAVAVGHWLVMVAYRDEAGDLVSGNGLAFMPGARLLTWLFQVMPLFFVVGGFASAASLDSKGLGRSTSAAGRADWIAGRMARLLPPVSALALFWLAAIVAGYGLGLSPLVNAGAVAAAIPLWFLANYTADIVLAPHVLPLFRRHRRATVLVGVGLFLALEAARLAGEHVVSHANWILGWFLFQVAGFAWRDGLLPTGRAMVAWAAGLWAAAIALVTFGPWSVSMVHFPGMAESPTHPPSLALMVFGAAQSATAIAAAPAVTGRLERRAGAWRAVVAANSSAMTVYLWHMTAAVAVTGAFDLLGLLGTSHPGTAAWWLAKIPFVVAAAGVMAVIVPRLSCIERNALLAPKGSWPASPWLLIGGAAVTSFVLKGWTSGSMPLVIAAVAIVPAVNLALGRLLRPGT